MLEYFKKLFKRIKSLYSGLETNSEEARMVERMGADTVRKIQDYFINVLADAGESYQAAGGTKNTTDNGGVRYSIKKTLKIPYAEQLQRIENGSLNGSNSLYIGKPAEAIQKAGLSASPFAMNQGDYRKSRRASAKNKKYSSHKVPFSFFEKMPHYMDTASMLIDKGEKATVITSYALKDTKGNDSYVIAGIWKDTFIEDDKVNQIKSVYPLDDFVAQIKKAAEEGQLVIIDKNKAENMLSTIGVQPAEVQDIFNLVRENISQSRPDVKHQSRNPSAAQLDYTIPRTIRELY